MDSWLPQINPEVQRIRQQAALRKRRHRLRYLRLLWSVVGVLLILLVIESLVVVSFSPRFWIYRIEVGGLETLNTAEVIRLMDLSEHSNFYRTSLRVLANRIEQHPRVSEAVVRRGTVGVVLVEVRERHPLCRVGAGQPPLYMDEQGVLFNRPIAPAVPVPIVEGVKVAHPDKAAGRKLTSRQARVVLDCLAAVREASANKTPLHIARVVVSPNERLTLVLKQGPLVRIGHPRDMPVKIWMLHQMIVQASTRGYALEQIEYFDVRVISKPTDIGAVYKPKSSQEAALE